jgi:hypothetical protein
MSDTELLLKKVEGFPPDYMAQIFDFIDQLSHKATPTVNDISKPNKFDIAAQSLGYKDHLDYLRANTPTTIEEAKAEAARKLNDPNRKPFSRHFGAVKGVYGDGMEYQRKMRNEWPD